jgi:signal transduction histidine kinase
MAGSKKLSQWHWMPFVVILIGIFSIVLLIWVSRISVKLVNNELLVDALMGIQINTARYHVRLEEFISGVASSDVNQASAALDKSMTLVDLILNGGETEYERSMEPLKNTKLRPRMNAVKSLMVKLNSLGMERIQAIEKPEVDSVLEPQFEAVYREALSETADVEDTVEKDEAQNEKVSRRIYLSIIVIWSFIVFAATVGVWGHERIRKNFEKELLKINDQLSAQTEELAEHREHLRKLVEERTAELSTVNKRLREEVVEHMQKQETLRESEKMVRHLSSRLIDAQEIERRRISMEIHDELGQALNVIKLRIRAMERGMTGDQQSLRKECEELLMYVDRVIEDIRRISLNLSPTVLDDIGITSAIEWILRDIRKNSGMNITSDITEIDHLFSQNHWITIHRIMQETFTNIMKHARAKNVSVVIRRNDDKVTFLIEDDGQGFDTVQTTRNHSSQKGMGLATMKERVMLMGGVFGVWSKAGTGTRVTFSCPVEKGA